jgi:hypothetical protein
MIDCFVEGTPVGWLLTFPGRPGAALLLESEQDRMAFASSCEVDLDGRDLLLALDLTEITKCPRYWFDEGSEFPDCPF